MSTRRNKHLLDALAAAEAARRALSDEPGLRERAPDLAFAVALRNRLVHGYDVIDDRIVFDTVVKDLPGLVRQLRELLSG